MNCNDTEGNCIIKLSKKKKRILSFVSVIRLECFLHNTYVSTAKRSNSRRSLSPIAFSHHPLKL